MNESLSRHKKGPFIASVEQPFAACCLITDKINKTYQGTLAQHAATAAPPHSELLLEPVPGAGARVLAQPVLEHAHPVPLVQGRPLAVIRVPHPHSGSAHCSLTYQFPTVIKFRVSFPPIRSVPAAPAPHHMYTTALVVTLQAAPPSLLSCVVCTGDEGCLVRGRAADHRRLISPSAD